MVLYYSLLYFFTYGFLGWCIEVAFAAVKNRQFVNRGFLNGPLCPIYGIGVSAVVLVLDPYKDNLAILYVTSAVLVTVLEYVTGALLEKLFHHKWWDYSKMPWNIKGYVCILFSLIWGAACVVIVKLIHPLIHRLLSFIPTVAGVIFLALLCAGLTADLCVTVAGILKWNRQLDAMEEMAEKLHVLSEQIGENIYKNMMINIEIQEEAKKKAEELKVRYDEMIEKQSRIGKRLLKAFPAMESKKHPYQLFELKNYIKEKAETIEKRKGKRQ